MRGNGNFRHVNNNSVQYLQSVLLSFVPAVGDCGILLIRLDLVLDLLRRQLLLHLGQARQRRVERGGRGLSRDLGRGFGRGFGLGGRAALRARPPLVRALLPAGAAPLPPSVVYVLPHVAERQPNLMDGSISICIRGSTAKRTFQITKMSFQIQMVETEKFENTYSLTLLAVENTKRAYIFTSRNVQKNSF